MRVTGGAGDIPARFAADDRDSRGIALDRDARIERRHQRLAVDLRQARTQRQPGSGNCEQQDRGGNAEGPEEYPLPEAAAHCLDGRWTLTIFIELVPPDTPENSPFVTMMRSPSAASPS